MSFTDDLERQVADAVREKSEEMVLEHARAVRVQMGPDGTGIKFQYVRATGLAPNDLGTLKVTGPEASVATFNKLLRQRMGQ